MALTAAEEAQLRDLIAQQSALLSLAGVEATILSKLGATKVTLSDLPSATAINDADLLLLRQGVTDKSVTGLTFKGLIPTVPDASETVKGKAEIATQAEVAAGADDARFVTALKLKSGFAISLTENGYIKLPSWLGGLVIQWGATSTSASADTTITFPIAFPSFCRSITTSAANYAAGSGCASYVSSTASITSTGFKLSTYASNTAARASITTAWIAIGY